MNEFALSLQEFYKLDGRVTRTGNVFSAIMAPKK
jgi:hypothetical protein